jgi:hypothetical protein
MRNDAPNLQPPLARDLFDLRRPAFRTASKSYDVAGTGSLIMELQAAAQHESPSVEEFLQTRALWAEGGDADDQRHLLGLRYYLKEVVEAATSAWEERADGHTNYRPLLNKIDRYRRENGESVLLVTFNYDYFSSMRSMPSSAPPNRTCKAIRMGRIT